MRQRAPTRRLRRWVVFNTVGLAGFAVQIGGIAVLTRLGGWHVVTATVVVMEAVIVQNYLAHSRWTWADSPPRTRRERIVRPLRYQGAKLISLSLNASLTAWLVFRGGLPPEAANLIAVGLCAILNYAAADRLVFRSREDTHVPAPSHCVTRPPETTHGSTR